MDFFKTLKESSQELKKLNNLLICAMLLALCVVFGIFGTVMIGPFLRITFSYLPIALGSMLFGPAAGGIIGAISDILNYIAAPQGPFFPGFTLNAIIMGLIFGFSFYKKRITLKRVIVTKLILMIVIDNLLTPLWLYMLYDKAFMALMAIRILKSIIQLPIDVAMIYFLLTRLPALISKSHKLLS